MSKIAQPTGLSSMYIGALYTVTEQHTEESGNGEMHQADARLLDPYYYSLAQTSTVFDRDSGCGRCAYQRKPKTRHLLRYVAPTGTIY